MTAYKDKEKGTWYVKFAYVDWTGTRRWTTKRGFSSRRKAEQYEREKKSVSEMQADITVSQLIDAYLEDRKIQLRPNTYRARESAMNNYVRPYLGKVRLTQLTPMRMRKWQNTILSRHNIQHPERALSRSTILMINSLCSILLNFAVKFYGLQKNPLSIIGPPKVQESVSKSEKIRIWEQGEFTKALEYVKELPVRCAFEILFYGGLRIGELMALDASDFDFEKNTISITKSYDAIAKKASVTKTASSVRTITMPATIMSDVRELVDKSSPVPSPLFHMSEVTLRLRIRAIAKEAGLPRIRVHDLRHSHASYLIQKGVPITTISHRLGHKNPNITLQVYSHMYKSADSDLAAMIENDIKKSEE